MNEREYLADENVGQWHHEVVKGIVDENQCNDSNCGMVVGVIFSICGRRCRPTSKLCHRQWILLIPVYRQSIRPVEE